MFGDQRIVRADPQWQDSTVTINATHSRIFFFQPFGNSTARTAIPQTPDRALPSIEHDVNEEKSSVRKLGILDRATSASSISVVPCSIQDLTDGDGDALPAQSLKNESEDESSLSLQGRLPFLLNGFGVERGFAGGESVHTTPQATPNGRLHTDSSPSDGERTFPTTSHRRQNFGNPITPEAENNTTSEFFRQQYDKLPKRHTPHRWSFKEREALCLLFIFYDVDRAFKDVTKVLNVLFQPAQESFRPRQVHAQWAVLQFIFRKRSVYDPKRAWLEKRTELEAAAERAGVHLTPRTTELIVRRPDPEHMRRAEEVAAQDAWFIKHLLESRERCVDPTSTRTSPPTDGFSNLEKSIAFQLLEAANSGDRPSTPLGHHATEQPIPNQGDTAAPSPSPYRHPQTILGYAPVFPQEESDDSGKPALLYRVYHEESCGHNSPTGFRAGLFNIPGQSLEPPPQDNRILPVFVSWHLWHHSVSSPFISCTDSLVMAVHKARQAEAAGLHPHLALISGAAATSNGHTCFRAGPLVLEARSRGLVPGMRYRGVREWLIWGEIARDAIVRDVPFGRLRDLPANYTGVADLLALDDIDPAPGVSLAAIRKGLLRQEVVLDGAAGFHVGRLVALLGLELASPVEMIEQVVYDIFQGWVLGVVVGELPGMAEAFLAGFRDAEGGRNIGAGGKEAMLLLDDDDETGLRAAFIGGVERALKDLRRERRYVRK